MKAHNGTQEVACGDAVEILVRCRESEAVALTPTAALVAARELMRDATVARVPGYLTVIFIVAGRVVRSLDGSQLVEVLRFEGLEAF